MQRDAEQRNEAFLIFRRVRSFRFSLALMALVMQVRNHGRAGHTASTHNLSAPSSRANQYAKQRRSQRMLLSVSILVSGTKPGGAAFSERTSTMIVSAHGAAILLRELVITGQKLKLKNVMSKEEIECVVVDVNSGHTDIPEVGCRVCRALPIFLARLFSTSRLESAKSGSQAVCLVDRQPKPAETKK